MAPAAKMGCTWTCILPLTSSNNQQRASPQNLLQNATHPRIADQAAQTAGVFGFQLPCSHLDALGLGGVDDQRGKALRTARLLAELGNRCIACRRGGPQCGVPRAVNNRTCGRRRGAQRPGIRSQNHTDDGLTCS